MPNGFGFRGGWGFGFRGASPPWPFVSIGRGGLPRCGYFLSGAVGFPIPPGYLSAGGPWTAPFYGSPWAMPYYGGYNPPASTATGAPLTAPGAAPFAPQMTREQELDFLKGQADTIRRQLEQIEGRIRELEE
ncbi:MAG: hypothetical protein QMC90_01030 [Dehalococcoidales bacterium]|nr:hypothetical protein [Dehalococcoidales bacterium]